MSRRLSLWALVIVLPIALWVAIGDHWIAYNKRNREQILDAPAGGSAVLEGSTWRLETADMVSVATKAVPRGTTRVLMRIVVTPRDAAAAERLQNCDVWLTSRDGRRWSRSTDIVIPREHRLPSFCHGNHRARPQPGAPFRFEQTFVVPTAVASEVEPLVILRKKRFDESPPPLLRLRRG